MPDISDVPLPVVAPINRGGTVNNKKHGCIAPWQHLFGGSLPGVNDALHVVNITALLRRNAENMERRKAWRMLQSKASVVNKDYQAQKALLAKLDKGELQLSSKRSGERSR